MDRDCLECWSVLAALAADTSKLRLGPLVLCQSYRYPSVVAKMAATLDVLSNGRLEFGYGAGWKEIEYRAYGYPFPPALTRIAQLREAVQIVKRMWTEAAPTFHGQYYQIREAICEPKPLQQPHPPLWIGGNGRRVLEVGVQYADGVNLAWSYTPATVQPKLQWLQGLCQKHGRDYRTLRKSLGLITIAAATEAELNQLLATLAARRGVSKPELLRQRTGALIGTPEHCVAQLRDFQRLGFTYFIFMFPYEHEIPSLRLFSEHVLPRFR